MKKIILFVFLFILLLPTFIPYSKAQGKTLQQLINDLDLLEQKFNDVNEEKKFTEEELNQITNNITLIGLKINEIENSIISIQTEIEQMNEEILEKEGKIKKLVNLMQKSEEKNFYLEFLFGSESLTDFIYRIQAIEQITAYNDKLIDDLNNMIEEVRQKDIDLKKEKEDLEKQNEELSKKQQELGSKVNILDEDARDLLEDIADAKKTINNYEKMGCSLNDTLEDCSRIPSDSSFLRPLTQGVITSGYGARENPVTGGYQFHAAIDIGGNPTGTSVYATASGRVVLTSYVKNPNVAGSSCGGNYIIIQHKINGVYYASRYMHLNQIYVTEGQEVTQNDIIGSVGGGEIYDRCTTGAHLDFSIAAGIYGKDFYSFRQPATINPYTLINFPLEGVYYTSRFTKY